MPFVLNVPYILRAYNFICRITHDVEACLEPGRTSKMEHFVVDVRVGPNVPLNESCNRSTRKTQKY